MARLTIVGAGESGFHAALALREHGWSDQILLIGAEPHVPYERPPLSKEALLNPHAGSPGDARARKLREAGVQYLYGIAVTGIQRAAHTVQTSDGQTLAYQRLLLATGATPRRLTCPGGEHAQRLRTFDDAYALKTRLRKGQHVAIIGGGLIGLEVAACARTMGCTVTLIEAGARLLQRGVPTALAARVAQRHAAAGVHLCCGVSVNRIEKVGPRLYVHLSDGKLLCADLALASIGVTPETQLAESAGLVIDNGIAVNGQLATTDPDIFAAGDCCAFPHPLFDARRIRVESWRNAQSQGAFAARAMLGASDAYAATPWFWSDQYNIHLQIAGLPDAGVQSITRTRGDENQLSFHLDATGRLLACAGCGHMGQVAKDVRLAERLIAQRIQPDPAALRNPDFNLKRLLAA